MTVTGHPDDQTYANWRGPDFFANASFNISNANPILAPGQMTNFASLAIMTGSTPAGGIEVAVQFYTDDTLAIPTTAIAWIVPQGMFLNVIVPAVGNFCQVTISTPTVAATPINVVIFPTNTIAAVPSYFGPLKDVEQQSVGIPAGTTQLFAMPQVCSGAFHAFFLDIAGSAHLSFSVVILSQAGAATITVIEEVIPVTNVAVEFSMDAQPLAVSVHNSDAAAHNAQFVLACRD